MKKLLILIIALGLLLAFQIKVVMPIVYDVISSDLFLEDSGDEKNSISETSLMTTAAFEQCNIYIANDLYEDHSFTFPTEPLNSFKLGNFQYIINAEAEVFPPNSASLLKKYVCRIKYLKDHDTTGLSEIDNWSIVGISGLDDI